MKLSFRWYGLDDPVTLEKIRQIPGMKGIITAIYDVPIGEIWPMDKIIALKKEVEKHNLELIAIESVPVHEDIKLGLSTRDKYIKNYKETIKNLGKAGIGIVTYNFMPVFDWTRSSIDNKMEDGSINLIYEHKKVLEMDPVKGELDLPGWATNYEQKQLKELLQKYEDLSEEGLWRNLEYFLKSVVPVAEKSDVKLAIHPDDPPWSIFGLPRIVTNKQNLKRLVNIIDSPSNGLAICTGSLGSDPNNNMSEIIEYFSKKDRLNFLHFRNVKHDKNKNFYEVAHLSSEGSLDMYSILKSAVDGGFDGPIRPDHGRMIWGEEGRAGYGLFDRALGATYINGLLEAIFKN
ncbi:mannonate dehydratase [Senegalia massiliensis]|uniref:Mannonate dehydratase n=1 Tax=Senegalia massiliensis TaxID=1720316 RepID=A0A845QWA1_9CLOT|nr:mannonate dehydratase [Senegalia massiliensis]NBI07197.1 mannonate dehydratase [Senegalia massiliensis]